MVPFPHLFQLQRFVYCAYKLWNLSTELRRAKSKHAAKRAKAVANLAPL